MDQITTFTILRLSGWKNKMFALQSMARFVPACKGVKGLEFIKLMGSGSGDGFSVWPDLGQYALMCVWKDESSAVDFFSQSPIFSEYLTHTDKHQTIYLRTTMVHGLWGGMTPFTADPSLYKEDQMVAVLTRATIRWKDMIRFWRDVPPVSKSLNDVSRPPLFAAGVGELPFRYQATFSIWENATLMKAFAYKTKFHADMVSKTRKVGWYSEELFARFLPYKSEGDPLIKFPIGF
jgi:hypothetical protein